MLQGRVKWFDDKKGFGFIAAEGQDYFAHFREITSKGFKTLAEGSQVSFTPEKSEKGWTAKNIAVAEDVES